MEKSEGSFISNMGGGKQGLFLVLVVIAVTLSLMG